MNSFALVLLLAAAASAASVPSPAGSGSTRGFPLYGHPAAAAGVRGDVAASEIPSTELQGWRSVYEKPTILAVKHEDKPEVTAFLAKDGLSGLAESPDTRFLHDMLRFGEEKVGVFLSASKFLPTGESDLPVSGMVFPKGFSLSDAAHAKMAAAGDFPWVLVAPKKDMRAADLSKLALVGDFKVTENGIKVASDIPAPAAAKWASSHAHFPTSAYAAAAGRRSSPNPFFAAAADEASFIPTASAGSGRFAMAYPGAPASAFAAIPAGARVAFAQPGAPVEAIAAYPSGAPFGKSTTFVTLPAGSRTFGSPAPVSAIIAEGFASPSPASAFESNDEATITLIPAGSAKYDKFEHFGHHGQYAPPCTPYFRAGSAKYDPYYNPASHFHGCAPYVLA